MKNSFVSIILLKIVSILITETDAFVDMSAFGVLFDYTFDAVRIFPIQQLNTPSNRDDSIQYLLYTPSNRNEPCFIQPSAKQLDKCLFNTKYETKFLIHGFAVLLPPENMFNILKDAILDHDNYNVIVVNWTLYNTMPFKSAYKNAKIVGHKVAEMMKFIKTHANVSLGTFHCIGHSLGSHVCGVAGRSVHTLGRITGLDPGGVSKFLSLTPNIRLRYTDAYFVDVMHTSDIYSVRGLGYLDPIGHLNFYPNGGVAQAHCVHGNTYKVFKGANITIQTTLDKIFCNHFITIEYFTNSLKGNCRFVATECQSYLDFKKGHCLSHIKTEMGFFTKMINGFPSMAKFYLTTLESPPYCKEENNPS